MAVNILPSSMDTSLGMMIIAICLYAEPLVMMNNILYFRCLFCSTLHIALSAYCWKYLVKYIYNYILYVYYVQIYHCCVYADPGWSIFNPGQSRGRRPDF